MIKNENYLEEAFKMFLEDIDNDIILAYINKQKELNKDISIKCWREDKNIPLPTYAHNGDAGCDLYVKSIEYDEEKDRYIVHTGLHIALDKDYECELRPRSSLTKTEFYIANAPGTIDEPYRGEITVVFKNRTNIEITSALCSLSDVYINIIDNFKTLHIQTEFPYKKGDRIAQLIVRKRTKIKWQEVNNLKELGETDRGSNGYGSSGK